MCPAAAASTATATVISTSPVIIWGNKAVLRNPQTGDMVDAAKERPAEALPVVKKPAKKKKNAAKKPAARNPDAQPEKKNQVERTWGLGHLNCMRSPAKPGPQDRKPPVQDQDLAWKPDEPQAPKLYRFGRWRQKGADLIYDMPCGGRP